MGAEEIPRSHEGPHWELAAFQFWEAADHAPEDSLPGKGVKAAGV